MHDQSLIKVYCLIDVDDCKEDSCMNNGKCVDGVDSVTCDCEGTGFEGDQCQDSK